MLFSRAAKISRPFKDLNQEKAALLLVTPTALAELNQSDESVVVSVLASGSLIGEMGILDGEPRSATCTATTELDVVMQSLSVTPYCDRTQVLVHDIFSGKAHGNSCPGAVRCVGIFNADSGIVLIGDLQNNRQP